MTRGLPLTLMLMLLALITYSQLNTPNSWQWQYPKPFKGAFLAVEKVSDGIIAGGEKSILQKTTDGGDTWVQIEVPEELSIRYMEFFNGGTTGYYFGEKGKPYKSTNSGNTWSIDNTFPTNDSIISANMYHDTLAVYYGSGANTYSAKLVAGGTWQTSVTAARVVAGHYPYYTSHNYTTIDTIYAFDTIRGTQSVPGGRYVCKIIPSYDELAVYLAVKEVVNGIVYSRLQYGIAAGQTQGSLSDGLGSYSHVFYQDANTWYASEVLESGISDFFDIGNFSKTTNGGQNWTSLGYVGVYDVEFDNAFENYAATTRAQVIKTINAGALYTNTQVGDYIKFTIDLTEYLVDIASIYQIGNVVYGYGLGRGVVSMTGVYKYMFVKSTDFGRTWTLLHAYDPQLTGFSPELYVTRKFIAFNDNEFWALKARRQDSYGSMSSSYSFLDIGSYNSGTTTVTSMQMSAEDLIDFHCFSSTNAVFLSNNSSTFANDLSRFIWDPVNLSPTITPISNSMGTF
ncbi:MAG: hypothetical protein JST49_05330, partial [Bacteroidetes bacterium]|nr:hypothetical protein [Bacteroidota bacterium]